MYEPEFCEIILNKDMQLLLTRPMKRLVKELQNTLLWLKMEVEKNMLKDFQRLW